MIHDIDLIQQLVGRPLATVDAVGIPVLWGEDNIANARLRFEGGCVVNVTASRVKPARASAGCGCSRGMPTVTIDFQAGEATMAPVGKCSGRAGRAARAATIEANDPLQLEIEAFLAAVRGERAVAISGTDGRLALEGALRITRALQRPP